MTPDHALLLVPQPAPLRCTRAKKKQLNASSLHILEIPRS